MEKEYQQKSVSRKDKSTLFEIETDYTRYDRKMRREESIERLREEIFHDGIIGGHKI